MINRVGRNGSGFVKSLFNWCAFIAPVACVNSLLKYSQVELSLLCREALSHHLYKKFLKVFGLGTHLLSYWKPR